MSIHFKLNRNATSITIKKHIYTDNMKKVETIGQPIDFTSKEIVLPNELTTKEQQKATNWITNQKKLIEDAFKANARIGLFGGTPVISESGKFNGKFKDLPRWNPHAPSYSFLGCIKDARRLSIKSDTIDSFEFEEIIKAGQLPAVSKSIIGAYCHMLIENPDEFANKAIAQEEIEQLVEANLLLSRFIALSKIKQKEIRANVDKRIDDYFNELLDTREGYLIGKKLKVSTLLTQRDRAETIDMNDATLGEIQFTDNERVTINNIMETETVKSTGEKYRELLGKPETLIEKLKKRMLLAEGDRKALSRS